MSAKLKNKNVPDAETYRELVDQLAMFTDASNQFAALDARVQQEVADIIDDFREEYSILQNAISEHEATVKSIALAHPEWFEAVKTLKTPYGTVGFRSATKLEVENEELTVVLIEQLDAADLYLRSRKFLNLEALETLEPCELATLHIQRVTTDKCTVTPAKLDLGKAVKKAVLEEAVN
jgi:hypothetical protein